MPTSITVADARAEHFRLNGFALSDYDARWVRLRLGPIPLGFPNTRARRAAVPLHDLHHVATGYATTWTGEAEIAAWELAAGCGSYWAAWVLDLGAVLLGLAIAPRRVARAFSRGRRSRTLYTQLSPHRAEGEFEAVLALSLDALRARLALHDAPPATAARST